MAYEQMTGEEMDLAANAAEQDLNSEILSANITQFADWWKRWYLKAGHKRLGRILLKYTAQEVPV